MSKIAVSLLVSMSLLLGTNGVSYIDRVWTEGSPQALSITRFMVKDKKKKRRGNRR